MSVEVFQLQLTLSDVVFLSKYNCRIVWKDIRLRETEGMGETRFGKYILNLKGSKSRQPQPQNHL